MSTTYDDPAVDVDLTAPPPSQGHRRLTIAAGVVAAVLVLIAAFGAGWLTHSRNHPGDDSPEAGFARDMSTHHAQAVEMGIEALEKTSQPEIRLLATDIVSAQQAQIGMMQTWLREWNLEPTGSKPQMSWMKDGASLLHDGLMPGMASAADMERLRTSTGAAFDELFLHLMQQHHLGGVHMIDGVLAETDQPDVVWLAGSMATNQRAELEVISQIQTKLNFK